MTTINAYAKINLTLEALNRRVDGYHETASIMQTVDLTDTLTFEAADDISLDCDVAELRAPDNLALKAAALLKAKTGYPGGAPHRADQGDTHLGGARRGQQRRCGDTEEPEHQYGTSRCPLTS